MGKVRFTGDRTGLDELSVYPYGLIKKGDVVEVDDETADRWTVLHPTDRTGMAKDLASRLTRAEMEAIAPRHQLNPDDFSTKGDLAEALFKADPTLAGQVEASDFEKVPDSTKADVSAFADKEAPAAAPLTMAGPAAEVSGETSPAEG